MKKADLKGEVMKQQGIEESENSSEIHTSRASQKELIKAIQRYGNHNDCFGTHEAT